MTTSGPTHSLLCGCAAKDSNAQLVINMSIGYFYTARVLLQQGITNVNVDHACLVFAFPCIPYNHLAYGISLPSTFKQADNRQFLLFELVMP